MEDVDEVVADVAATTREIHLGGQVKISPPRSQACDTCPWRLKNHERPPLDRPRPTPAEYYTPRARELMWGSWDDDGEGLADGRRATCHLWPNQFELTWCAGGDGILQREMLRWWLAGRSATRLAPLRGPDAVRHILAAVLGVWVARDDEGRLVTAGLSLEPDGDRLQPCLNGTPLELEAVARLAHPAVLHATVGAEPTAPLDPGEVANLECLHLGEDWRNAGAHWTTWLNPPSD